MNTRGVRERFRPFKRDSARRIDRVIDYFGESRRRPALYVVRPQWSSRTESGVSVIVSLSARTR
jgi:hypothetical protein